MSLLKHNIKKFPDSNTPADDNIEEFLKKEQIQLDDGTSHPMLLRMFTRNLWTYLCFPCGATCLGETFLHSHLKGKKHNFIILSRPSWPKTLIDNHPYYKTNPRQHVNVNSIPVSDESLVVAPGEPVPPGVEVPSELEESLPSQEKPVVGLEYFFEILDDEKEPSYFCALCDVKGDPRTILKHIDGFPHKIKYLASHYPRSYRALKKFTGKNHQAGKVQVVENICKCIEKAYGRLKPMVVSAEGFDKNRTKLLKEVHDGKHFTEKDGGSFEELVDEEYIVMVSQMNNGDKTTKDDGFMHEMSPSTSTLTDDMKQTDGEKMEKFKTDKNKMERFKQGKSYRRRLSLDSISSLSDICENDDDVYIVLDSTEDDRMQSSQKKNKFKMKSNERFENKSSRILRDSPKRSGNGNQHDSQIVDLTEVANLSEKDKWEEYRSKMKIVCDDAKSQYKYFENFPEKHPCYDDEWKKFWTKRCQDLQIEKKDIWQVDLKPEWIRFWSTKMKDIYDEDLAVQRRNILNDLNLPVDFDNPIADYSKNAHGRDPNKMYCERFNDRNRDMDLLNERGKSRERSRERNRNIRSQERSWCKRSQERNHSIRGQERNRIIRTPERNRNNRSQEREQFNRSIERSRSNRSMERGGNTRSPEYNRNIKSPERSLDRGVSWNQREDRKREFESNKFHDIDERDFKIRRRRSPSRSPPYKEHYDRVDSENYHELKRNWSLFDDKFNNYIHKTKKKYNEYKENPRLHPDYEDEYMQFKDRRKNDFHNANEMKMEWFKYWGKKIKDLQDDDIYNRKQMMLRDFGISPAQAREFSKDSRKYDKHSSNDHHFRSFSNEKKKPSQMELDNLNVVSVLRHLTALENYLGSLGPKVVDLLGIVLKMEKEKPNSSDEILNVEEYCVLLETVKEKLKGQLLADLIEPHVKQAAKLAIQYAATLVHRASVLAEKLRLKLEEDKKLAKNSPVTVVGIGAVEKAAIANQIATVLIAQGKPDVTTEELETLINAVVGMANASQSPSTKPLSGSGLLAQLAEIRQKDSQAKEAADSKSGLDFLRSAYDKQLMQSDLRTCLWEKNAPFADKLSDSDLKTLLQNFKNLSTDEQQGLISYLKKLEASNPTRVEHLRKFIDIDLTVKEQLDKFGNGRPTSPFSARRCGGNPMQEDAKHDFGISQIKSLRNKDSDDDEDYNYDEVIKSAAEKVKEKQLQEEMDIIKQSLKDSSNADKNAENNVNLNTEDTTQNNNISFKTNNDEIDTQSIVNVLNMVKNTGFNMLNPQISNTGVTSSTQSSTILNKPLMTTSDNVNVMRNNMPQMSVPEFNNSPKENQSAQNFNNNDNISNPQNRSQIPSLMSIQPNIDPSFLQNRINLEPHNIKNDSMMNSSQIQDNQSLGNQTLGNKMHGNQFQNNQMQGMRMQGNQLQGNQLQGNRLQGNHMQRNPIQGNQPLGNRMQGNQMLGNRMQGHQMRNIGMHGNQMMSMGMQNNQTQNMSMQGNQLQSMSMPGNHMQPNKMFGNNSNQRLQMQNNRMITQMQDGQMQGNQILGCQNQGGQMQGSQMQGSQMQGSQMQGSQMQGSQMQGSQMQGSQMQGSQMRGGKIQGSQMQGGQMQGGQMQGNQMRGNQMQGNQMQGSQMQGGQMQGGQMQGGQMQGGQMQGGQMQGGQMQGGQMQGGQMQSGQMHVGQMQGGQMQGNQMRGNQMQGNQMQGSQMQGSQMQGSQMQGSQMQGSQMLGSQMQGSQMQGSQMQGSQMQGSQMQGNQMQGSQMQGGDQMQGGSKIGGQMQFGKIQAGQMGLIQNSSMPHRSLMMNQLHNTSNNLNSQFNSSSKFSSNSSSENMNTFSNQNKILDNVSNFGNKSNFSNIYEPMNNPNTPFGSNQSMGTWKPNIQSDVRSGLSLSGINNDGPSNMNMGNNRGRGGFNNRGRGGSRPYGDQRGRGSGFMRN